MHGNVFRAGTSAAAGEVALKVHRRRDPFELELETYLRLREANVAQLLGFNVPQSLVLRSRIAGAGNDGGAAALCLSFFLDFAEVRLDLPLEFPDDVWTHWLEEKLEQFGERWPVVQRVLAEFEALDIYLLDVSPRNIAFRD